MSFFILPGNKLICFHSLQKSLHILCLYNDNPLFPGNWKMKSSDILSVRRLLLCAFAHSKKSGLFLYFRVDLFAWLGWIIWKWKNLSNVELMIRFVPYQLMSKSLWDLLVLGCGRLWVWVIWVLKGFWETSQVWEIFGFGFSGVPNFLV